jgi:hypothetical protein
MLFRAAVKGLAAPQREGARLGRGAMTSADSREATVKGVSAAGRQNLLNAMRSMLHSQNWLSERR